MDDTIIRTNTSSYSKLELVLEVVRVTTFAVCRPDNKQNLCKLGKNGAPLRRGSPLVCGVMGTACSSSHCFFYESRHGPLSLSIVLIVFSVRLGLAYKSQAPAPLITSVTCHLIPCHTALNKVVNLTVENCGDH